MRVLILTDEIPATSEMPGCPRIFNLGRELARDHEMWVLALDPSRERCAAFEAAPGTRGVFRELTRVDPPTSPGFWPRQDHRVHLEPHLSTRRLHPEFHAELCRRVEETVRSLRIDVILVERLRMTQYVPPDGVPAVVDLCDSMGLHFEREARTRTRWLQKLDTRLEGASLARWERRLWRRFASVILVAERDEEAIRSLAPRTATVTITNGVDVDYFRPGEEATDGSGLAFTGVMAFRPNADAVHYFVDEVFPAIREREPAATFWAIGHDPGPDLRRLGERPGVEITGSVEDIRPYVHAARLFVSPVRYGSGIKNKILAAMAMGKPVVATPLSLHAIDAEPERDVLLAEEPKEFAEQVLRVLQDDDLARRLGERGRRLVVEKYSWKARAEQVDAILRRAVGQG